MQRLIKISFFMLCFIVALVSCSKNKNQNPLQDLQNKSMTYEDFFKTISEKEVSVPEDKVLFISYEFNAKDETITLLSSTEAFPSEKVVWDAIVKHYELEASREGEKYDYIVTCDKGWSKKCEAYSCLSVVKNCLNQGGCATVCKANMVYVPDIKAFYVSSDIDELVSSKVEGEF